MTPEELYRRLDAIDRYEHELSKAENEAKLITVFGSLAVGLILLILIAVG